MITIIIPAYNAQQGLQQCLDSLYAQTCTDWEAIIVDDGSTDQTAKICNTNAAKDSRIRVIHQPNGGVSRARNRALDEARGEWVCFVDSDDHISPNYLQTAQQSEADLVILSAHYCDPSGSIFRTVELPPCQATTPEAAKQLLKTHLHNDLMRLVCSKLIRRSVIGDTRFRTDLPIGEDTLFFLDIYSRCKHITALHGHYYYWQAPAQFSRKYARPAATCAQYLDTIIQGYERLAIPSPDFEHTMFNIFYRLCDRHQSLRPWFRAPIVRRLWPRVRSRYKWNRRLSYVLRSIGFRL